MLAAIVVVYPVASLMFRLRYRHGERLPPRGPVLLVANHVSILDPLACARLVFDNGRLPHFLAKQSVFKGFAGHAAAQRRPDPGRPVLRRRARGAGRREGRPRRRQPRRDLPRGLGHPRSGLVADAGAHRGRPAGPDHRRRRPAGGPVGPAARCTTTTARSCSCASGRRRTTWSASRSTCRPQRAQVRAGPAAERRAAEGDDRPDHGPRARPAGRAARRARAPRPSTRGPAASCPATCPGSAA